MKKMSAHEFARRLRRFTNDPNKRVVFFLGAGCSLSSGISLADTLTKDWIKELWRVNKKEGVTFEEWIQNSGKYRDYNDKNAAQYYSQVISDLFLSEEERQQEIETIVANKDPGFGYAVLATLIGHDNYGKTFTKILTTNFDDLAADALYIYSNKKPLVISHDSLIGYARISSLKPTIIKLHGDAHLSPKNTNDELEELDQQTKKAITNILKESFLVFLGYGANDKGILNILNDINELKGKVYWVNNHLPKTNFKKWLDQINAIWVEHLDFDQLMLIIFNEFGLKQPNKLRFEQLITKFEDTYNKLKKNPEGRYSSQPETYPDKFSNDRRTESWSIFAGKEVSKYKMSDSDEIEKLVREALGKNPNDKKTLENYADFLFVIRKDLDKAKRYYMKSIDPTFEQDFELSKVETFIRQQSETLIILWGFKMPNDAQKYKTNWINKLNFNMQRSIEDIFDTSIIGKQLKGIYESKEWKADDITIVLIKYIAIEFVRSRGQLDDLKSKNIELWGKIKSAVDYKERIKEMLNSVNQKGS